MQKRKRHYEERKSKMKKKSQPQTIDSRRNKDTFVVQLKY